MKATKLLTFFFLTILLSCSKSDDSPEPVIPTIPTIEEYTFDIAQDIPNIMECDHVMFYVIMHNENTILTEITWYLDDVQVGGNSFEKTFRDFGTYHVKLVVSYVKGDNSTGTATVEKDIMVAERPKHIVKVSKVEILSNSQDDEYFVSPTLGYYMKAKFEIEELDESLVPYIDFASGEDVTNFDGGPMTYPISWNISSANYLTKVYQTGSYYPNDHNGYHIKFTFFAAKRISSGASGPFIVFSNYKLDLNPHRALQPTTVDVLTSQGLQVRFTLEWN